MASRSARVLAANLRLWENNHQIAIAPQIVRPAPLSPAQDQCLRLELRIDVAAERLAVSRATLYRMVQRGELPTVRIGSAVRVPVSALERWLPDQMTSIGASA